MILFQWAMELPQPDGGLIPPSWRISGRYPGVILDTFIIKLNLDISVKISDSNNCTYFLILLLTVYPHNSEASHVDRHV